MALVAIFETVYVGMLGTTPLAAIALVFPLIMLMQMLSAERRAAASPRRSAAHWRRRPCACRSLALHAVVTARRPDSSSARSWRSAP
jgi:Na+-driven multidrug efflux pump